MDPLSFAAVTIQFFITFAAIVLLEHARRRAAAELQRFVHLVGAAATAFLLGSFLQLLQLALPAPDPALFTFLVGFCYAATALVLIFGSFRLALPAPAPRKVHHRAPEPPTTPAPSPPPASPATPEPAPPAAPPATPAPEAQPPAKAR